MLRRYTRFTDEVDSATVTTASVDAAAPSGSPVTQPQRLTSTQGTGELRTVFINDSAANARTRYVNNQVATAKYNVLTLIPRFLFEQFSRTANVFFLCIALIQQIPGVSPMDTITTVLPLCIVLATTAVKEIFEDAKRHRMDYEVNNRKTLRLDAHGEFVPVLWSRIKVGDFIKIQTDEYFPADMVLVSSSEPDGICYVETANLDGETNLKIRQSLPDTADITSSSQAHELTDVIRCEQPNNSLYTFEGVLGRAADGAEVPLGPNQLLLRGAQLRNCRWIFGVVIFTGRDTKLFRNSNPTPIKRTAVEKITNMQILFMFILLVAMALFCAGFNAIWLAIELYKSPIQQLFYLQYDMSVLSNYGLKFVLNVLTFLILFQNLIPISLIVTMEIVKFGQALLINSDIEMYYEPNDTPARARTSNLIEELGQVQYVFSDKTGTLTENKMEFQKASIAGRNYYDETKTSPPKPKEQSRSSDAGNGHFHDSSDDLETTMKLRNDSDMEMASFHNPLSNSEEETPIVPMEPFSSIRSRLVDQTEDAPVIHEFFTLLAVCHTVIPELDENAPNGVRYQASSPDEAALVKGASAMDYTFMVRRPRSVTIKANNLEVEYQILAILEFNSTRKRMSVIVRTPEGNIKLFTKGADTVILERLRKQNQPFVQDTLVHLEAYAQEGLRTLCLAMRVIEQDEFDSWKMTYDAASTSLVERETKLMDAAELIEKDLFLVGATAVEDKLQQGVPDTIQVLARANIKLWVLTGDRQETAINIGYSCKLITQEMSTIICNEDSMSETKAFLENRLQAVEEMIVNHGSSEQSFALVIDGKSLKWALEKDCADTFVQLGRYCRSVICCRVSPLQKAQVVKLVKRKLKKITLAIGDGANDVGMIQAAHIGVGISGEEGLQAARSADYAIAQFRFLKRLLLVHGSWSYRRLSKLILYCFYKNITLYMIQFWFAFFNGFSGQIAFEEWTISLYNVIFTALAPITIGIFDQFLSSKSLLHYPELYRYGQSSKSFNAQSFWVWNLNAMFHSFLIYFFTVAFFQNDLLLANGQTAGLWFSSTLMYTMVIVVVTLKASIITDTWTIWSFISTWGSLAVWFVFVPAYIAIGPSIGVGQVLYGLTAPLFSSPVFWLATIVVPALAMMRDSVWLYFKRMYRPRGYVIVQEIERFRNVENVELPSPHAHTGMAARLFQRIKKNRGYAFSQNESGQAELVQKYDTTAPKPSGN